MEKAMNTGWRAAAWIMAITLVSGCNSAMVKNVMPEDMFPPSPGQAAREAFNVYDADVRRKSVARLSAAPFGGEAPYVKTYRLLLDDPDPTVRAACAHALGLHGEVEDADRLILRLKDDTTIVRWEVAKALQKIHNPRAIKALIEALATDADPDVRMSAATALGQYPDMSVFNALVGALEDQNYSVIVAAREALRTLTGQDFGNSGADWLAWARDSREHVFAERQSYTWTPYVAPETWWEAMQVWKADVPPPAPRRPTGEDATERQPLDDGSVR
jgi:hypothetical protein